MEIYQTTNGILTAKIVRYTDAYVILQLKFEGQGEEFIQLTRSSFDSLDLWIRNNYKLK